MGCCSSWTALCPCGYRQVDDKDVQTSVGRSTFYFVRRWRMDVDEVAEDVLGVGSKLAKPIQEIIERPKVPYTGPIPNYFEPGRMVVVHGTVTRLAAKFAVNLMCGTSANDDVAFHINPRFDQKYVVRNSRIGGRWGDEEDAVPQRYPFRRGEKFVMVIFVTEEQFMVAVNGRHFCCFRYRLPLHRINTVEICGDLEIDLIEHRKGTIYPEPSSLRSELFQQIDTEKINIEDFDQLEPPYIGLLPSTFGVGQELEIVGKVKLLPYSFYVNLQQGQQNWPHPLILLHVTPYFLVKSDTVTQVVYNSWLDGEWGTEQLTKALPFHPGTAFKLNVRCQENCFSISVDGLEIANYKHRRAPELVDTICIEGDVWIFNVRVKKGEDS